MKKIIFGMVLACFAFLTSSAQEIEFKKELHNYGTIENGADGTCEFKFKNTGKEDLLISNCRASCGCTIPSWPRTPIKPGKSETIKVKYDTKRIGGIHKTITITSNAKSSPTKVLTIKGTVKPPAAVPAPKTVTAVAKPVPVKKVVAPKAPEKKVEATRESSKKKRRWFQFWKKKN